MTAKSIRARLAVDPGVGAGNVLTTLAAMGAGLDEPAFTFDAGTSGLDAWQPLTPRQLDQLTAEAVASALAICRGMPPPTHNLDAPDPECDLDHVRGTGRASQIYKSLSNSFAFGGHNVSLMSGRPVPRAEGGLADAPTLAYLPDGSARPCA
jgi:hypothetical protein